MSKTYHITTFGCQMNARDSEKLAGILDMMGYSEIEDETADIVVINTCTVRENANDRVYGHLGQLKNAKKKNPDMVIAICGCMMQEPDEVERIKKSYPYVNLVFGTYNIWKFPKLLEEVLSSHRRVFDTEENISEDADSMPVKRVFPFKSGVNIMYGCNNFCTYCIVPYVRGRERSRLPESIIGEIKNLVADGVKEVMLLGQNVNSYAYDFPNLLREVCKVEGLERVRFMTSNPKDLSDELIKVMATEKKICRHLHLPLQSGSTKILSRMNRHYTKEHYLELVEKLRNRIPGISITTDIIVGFPGETDEDFNETLDVVKKAEYESAFTFIYSKRTGTPAAAYEGQVDSQVVKRRFNELLGIVQDISVKKTELNVGKVMSALVEDVDEKENDWLTGRLSNNYVVHFPGDNSLIGQIVDVQLDEAKGFYYSGHMI